MSKVLRLDRDPYRCLPQPYREIAERAYWVGWCAGQYSSFNDPYHYGIGFAAGMVFRLSELLYDLD